MKKKLTFIFTLSFLSFGSAVLAHTIVGTIKNEAGEPIPFATIYVEETGTGVTTNLEGTYRVVLGAGDYTVVYQHLGYQTERRKVSLGATEQEINIILKEQAFELKTVDVLGNSDE